MEVVKMQVLSAADGGNKNIIFTWKACGGFFSFGRLIKYVRKDKGSPQGLQNQL